MSALDDLDKLTKARAISRSGGRSALQVLDDLSAQEYQVRQPGLDEDTRSLSERFVDAAKGAPGLLADSIPKGLLGVAKSGLGTASGIASLMEKGVRKLTPESFTTANEFLDYMRSNIESAQEGARPQNMHEQIGSFMGDMGQFFIPFSKTAQIADKGTKFIRGMKSAPGIFRSLMKRAVQGGMAGAEGVAFEALKEGDFDTAKQAFWINSMFPIAGKVGKEALVKPIAKSARWLGEKITKTSLRASSSLLNEKGFKPEWWDKYGLRGDLGEGLAIAQKRIEALAKDLDFHLKKDPSKMIDLEDIFKKLETHFSKANEGEFFFTMGRGKRGAIMGEFRRWRQEVLESLATGTTMGPGGKSIPLGADLKITLSQAQKMKQGAGWESAYLFNPASQFNSRDITAAANANFYTALNTAMREAIEDAVPGAAKGINGQLRELMMLQEAIIKRIPVNERNQLGGLVGQGVLFAGVMSGKGPQGMGFAVANQMAKDVRVGQTLKNLANRMEFKNLPRETGSERAFSLLQELAQGVPLSATRSAGVGSFLGDQ